MKNKYLMAVLFIGSGLRLFQVSAAPLWYDETFSAWLAGLPLWSMIQATAGDVHPPLYQLIIWPIGQLGGGAFLLRLPSVICSTISLVLLWRICQALHLSETTSLVAVGLAAIAPLNIHFAQEARQYALLQMLVLGGALAAIQRRWLWIGVVGLALLYTHNYGLFYFASLGLASLALEFFTTTFHLDMDTRPGYYNNLEGVPTIQSDYRGLILAYVLPVLAFLPWAAVLANQMQAVSGGYWIQFSWGNVLYVINCLVWGFSMPEQAQPVGVFILAAVLCLAVLAAGRDRLRWPLWLGLAPLAMAVVVSLVWRPVLLFRGLVGSAPFLYLLVANLITRPGPKPLRIAVSALLVPVVLVGLVNHYIANPVNKDSGTSSMLADLADWYRPGDQLIYTNDAPAVIIGYHMPDVQGAVIADCANLGGLSSSTRAAMGIDTVRPADLPTDWSGLLIYAIGPTSSQCEEDAANSLAADSLLLREYKNDSLTTVRIYSHGGGS